MITRRSGLAQAWYGTIWLGDPDVEYPSPEVADLVSAHSPWGFYVHTGTHEGFVQLQIAVGDTGNVEDWDDEATMDIVLASTTFASVSIGGDEMLELELPTPGNYRVRVRGRNRVETDDEPEVPDEAYLIEITPA